jgi:hypothetical protein
MNENHQRHLLSTFQHVDNLLSEAERILISAGSPSPFQEYEQDSTPGQRNMTHDYIVRARATMRRILEELKIPSKPPISGALWAARNHLAFAGMAIVEIEPKHMEAYGKLSEKDKKVLDKITTELNELFECLGNDLAKGADEDSSSPPKPSDNS